MEKEQGNKVVKTEERKVNERRMDLGREEGGGGGRIKVWCVVKGKEDKTALSGGRNIQLLGVRENQQKRILVSF